jgi:undecaprenol kinase/diacylglycerol kinase (ATP)
VETIVDAQIEEFHPLAKVAKDVAAGAVLVMSVIAVLVGICVLGPPLWEKMSPMLGLIFRPGF